MKILLLTTLFISLSVSKLTYEKEDILFQRMVPPSHYKHLLSRRVEQSLNVPKKTEEDNSPLIDANLQTDDGMSQLNSNQTDQTHLKMKTTPQPHDELAKQAIAENESGDITDMKKTEENVEDINQETKEQLTDPNLTNKEVVEDQDLNNKKEPEQKQTDNQIGTLEIETEPKNVAQTMLQHSIELASMTVNVKEDIQDKMKEKMASIYGDNMINNTPNDELAEIYRKKLDSDFFIEGKPRIVLDAPCNRDFLGIFTLYGRRIDNAYKTTIADHDYCFNDSSCCSDEHFENLFAPFAKKVNELREFHQPIIELLSFFRGDSILNIIKRTQGSKKCIGYLKDEGESAIDLADPETFKEYQKLIVSFIDQMKDIRNMKESLFANMLCTICSPAGQTNMDWDEDAKKLTFTVNTQICNVVYKIMSFEAKLIFLFRHIILRVGDFLICQQKLDPREYSVRRKFLFNHELLGLNIECFNNFSIENSQCLQMCSKNLDFFEMNMSTKFKKHICQALKLYNKALTGNDIESHYEKRLDKEFDNYINDKSVKVFSKKSPLAMSYNVKRSKIVFSEQGGINPFLNGISFGFWNQIDHLVLEMNKTV